MNGARLIVLSGPEKSGKMPLAVGFMDADPSLVLVSRDALRTATRWNGRCEETMTHLMVDVARFLLRHGIGVVVHAWNLEPIDRELWTELAASTGATLEWIDAPAAWERITGPRRERAA